jgi:hypothetical protein
VRVFSNLSAPTEIRKTTKKTFDFFPLFFQSPSPEARNDRGDGVLS